MTDEQFIEKLYAETRALTAGVDTRKGESVDTSQLQEGDLILSHDMLIRLGERHVVERVDRYAEYGPVYWFVGTVENADKIHAMGVNHVTCGLLRGNEWTVQGNRLASWWRISE
jgi:hypothetical protein